MLFENIRRTFNTILFAGNHCLLTFLAPIWLAAIGLSGLTTGVVITLQTLLRFLASPFVGHLTNKETAEESLVGSALTSAAWIPWLISSNAAWLFPSSGLWFVGNHFYNVGILSRWYKGKTTAHIAAREICQGIGRLSVCFIVIPFLYMNTQGFFTACLIFSVAGIIGSFYEAKRSQKV